MNNTLSQNSYSYSFSQLDVLRRGLILTGGSLLTAVVVGYLSIPYVYGMQFLPLIAILGVMGLSFATQSVGDTPVGYSLVLAIGALLGLAAGPTVAMFLAAGAAGIVIKAAVSTGVIFLTMATIAIVTKKDFTSLGMFFGVALLAGMIVSLLNVFFFKSSAVDLFISYLFALGSAALILVRLSYVVRGGETSAVSLATGLVLDIYNLFMSLLRIFSSRD